MVKYIAPFQPETFHDGVFICHWYVSFISVRSTHRPNLLISCIEHMEDDEETSRSIPKWVELEYNVRTVHDVEYSPSEPVTYSPSSKCLI